MTLPIDSSSSPVPAASSPGCRSGLPHRVDPRLRVVPLSPRGGRERFLSRTDGVRKGFRETFQRSTGGRRVVHRKGPLLHRSYASVHSLCTTPVDGGGSVAGPARLVENGPQEGHPGRRVPGPLAVPPAAAYTRPPPRRATAPRRPRASARWRRRADDARPPSPRARRPPRPRRPTSRRCGRRRRARPRRSRSRPRRCAARWRLPGRARAWPSSDGSAGRCGVPMTCRDGMPLPTLCAKEFRPD